jgi:hypothetical protein
MQLLEALRGVAGRNTRQQGFCNRRELEKLDFLRKVPGCDRGERGRDAIPALPCGVSDLFLARCSCGDRAAGTSDGQEGLLGRTRECRGYCAKFENRSKSGDDGN